MPMSSGGYAASSSGCATRPKVREIGSTGYAGPTQHSSPVGGYVMATAEHREPCDSRGSCTVLGAPGGEIPPGDSTDEQDQSAYPPITALPAWATGAVILTSSLPIRDCCQRRFRVSNFAQT